MEVGWYPVASKPNIQQYWDGSQWTTKRRPKDGGWREFSEIEPESVAESVVTELYRIALSDNSRLRSSAQAGFGIASAVAGGLILVGAFGGVNTRPTSVQVLVGATILVWIITSLIYLWAVLVSPEQDIKADSIGELAAAAVESAEKAGQRTHSRINGAIFATVLAAILTVSSLATVWAVGSNKTTVGVTLSPTESSAVRALCPHLFFETDPPTFIGELTANDLQQSLVVIDLPPSECNGVSALTVPRSSVVAVEACSGQSLDTESVGTTQDSDRGQLELVATRRLADGGGANTSPTNTTPTNTTPTPVPGPPPRNTCKYSVKVHF